jgi:predicted deacylase
MPNKAMTIMGQEILPGKNVQLNLNVARLHTHTPIQVPVFVNRAKSDGPTVLLMAGVHGDEINGIEIVRRIIKNGFNQPIAGTIICLPVFNVFGFLNLARTLPDGRDLNRCFPGSKNGSLASQFASQFMSEIAVHADYVIDFHTGAAQRNNAPQIRFAKKDLESQKLAKKFAPPFLVHSNFIPKSLREALFKTGKRTLLFEGGKSLSIEEKVVVEGVEGVKRILHYLDMAKHDTAVKEKNNSILVESEKWMRAPMSGMFQAQVENGKKVEKNQIIGILTDPFGKSEKKIKAPTDGYVFCINESPVVNKGDAIFHIGIAS